MRQGLGKGYGKGYKNILTGHDSKVHQDSGSGKKQPQKISYPLTRMRMDNIKPEFKKGDIVKNRRTGIIGKIITNEWAGIGFVIETRTSDGKVHRNISESTAEYWEKV